MGAVGDLHLLATEVTGFSRAYLQRGLLALYAHGSYCHEATDAWSDLDLAYVHEGSPEACEVYWEWRRDLRTRFGPLPDPVAVTLPELGPDADWHYGFLRDSLRREGRLLLGEDLGEAIALPSQEVLRLGCVYTGCLWIRRLYDVPTWEPLPEPLAAEPQPLGYYEQGGAAWQLHMAVLQLLRAVVFLETGVHHPDRRDMPRVLREMGDPEVSVAEAALRLRAQYARFADVKLSEGLVREVLDRVPALASRLLGAMQATGLEDPSFDAVFAERLREAREAVRAAREEPPVQPPEPSVRPQTPRPPRFETRGVVLIVRDMETTDWPAPAQRVGLTTIGTHVFPHEIGAWVQTEPGARFLARCRELGIAVEHELHAMSDLLPRELFDRDPSMFRMDDSGTRVREDNLCVHSEAALQVVCENAARYTERLPSTTGRYFYWLDDGRPMCRCPECRGLTDSEQALIVENRVLHAVRTVDPRAMLAHLAYHNTLPAPVQVQPEPGVFLEFAPISRAYDRPFRDRDAGGSPNHGELLDYLDANLEVFPRETAQALEYWLDLSRFSGWKRENVQPLPWHPEVFADDADLYASRGIGHVTTFAAWLDGDYVARFGEPPIKEYGRALAGG